MRKYKRSKRRNSRRVPGMLRAPKWGLYRTGGRKRRYNPSRGEMLRAGTHRARRHALGAIRAGDPRTAQRYLGLEERLMARRRALGLNARGRGVRRNKKRPGPMAYRRGYVSGRHGGLVSDTSGRRYGGAPYNAGFDRGFARYLEATEPRHPERFFRGYNPRGSKRWIQGAVRRPGALRAKLARGYVPGYRLKAGQKIPETLLERAYSCARATGDTQTMRQVNLARRFLGMARSRRRGRRAYRKVAN